jgi:hypothetical protein
MQKSSFTYSCVQLESSNIFFPIDEDWEKYLAYKYFVHVHAMKAYSGSGGLPLPVLSLGATWRLGCQPHMPDALPPGKNPSTLSAGGCVYPRTGFNGLEERKISYPCRDSTTRIVQPVAWSLYQLNYPASFWIKAVCEY